MYLNGDGVEKNLKYAVKLFRYASKRGNVKAQCNLAMLYMKGLVERRTQYRKAFSLYRQAAAKGYAGGLYGVGYMLYKGIGVEQSYKEAISYLNKGAEKKHSFNARRRIIVTIQRLIIYLPQNSQSPQIYTHIYLTYTGYTSHRFFAYFVADFRYFMSVLIVAVGICVILREAATLHLWHNNAHNDFILVCL